MQLSFFLLLLPLLATPAASRAIFILAGQSNMSGRGGANATAWDSVVPPECRPSPAILSLSAQLQWEEARDPLHQDIDTYAVCGVGPGMPFANWVLLARPGLEIGLVPCAVGATTIEQWARGSEFYERMVARARVAAASGEVAAVLWYQGESNSVKEGDAQTYTAKVEELIGDVRADLDLPNLLFIQVQIATGMGPYIEPIRAVQRAVRLPNVITVDAKGCQVSQDYVHLTTSGQVQLGSILAKAYLQATR